MAPSKELLELAIRQTAQRTGFIPDLIEKDYYCSLILRAALTRTKPAIRDIFDLDYAIRHQIIDFNDKQLQDLAKIKLSKPDVLAIDLSENKKQILKSQLEGILRPVLKEENYKQFDFEKAWNDLEKIGEKFI